MIISQVRALTVVMRIHDDEHADEHDDDDDDHDDVDADHELTQT